VELVELLVHVLRVDTEVLLVELLDVLKVVEEVPLDDELVLLELRVVKVVLV